MNRKDSVRTACFRFLSSLRLIDRPHQCQMSTAVTARMTPPAAPPAIAATGTASPCAWPDVSCWGALEDVAFGKTVVVSTDGGGTTATMDVVKLSISGPGVDVFKGAGGRAGWGEWVQGEMDRVKARDTRILRPPDSAASFAASCCSPDPYQYYAVPRPASLWPQSRREGSRHHQL